MMITRQDLENKVKEFQVPYNAVFSEVPKKLRWGGDNILESIYRGELDNKWLTYGVDMEMDDYARLCKRLAENESVAVFCVSGKNFGHLWFKILADDSFKNEVELVSGLENYAKIGG